jgi:hypothetical protein
VMAHVRVVVLLDVVLFMQVFTPGTGKAASCPNR